MDLARIRRRGLGNTSYLLEVAPGRAVAIDPDRGADRVLREAEQRDWEVVASLDTHLHADFVAGNIELRERCGSEIYIAEEAGVGFAHTGLRAGEHLDLGGAEIEVLATPGHSPEHLSFVVRGAAGDPPMLFSGGALIAGGAARTDLVSFERTEELTRAQFRTMHGAFDHLPDETLLLPTHGAGSFCSAGSGRDATTLGAERSTNPLLAETDEERFVREWPRTFPAIPAYFSRMRRMNAAGPRPVAEIEPPPSLDAAAFELARRDGGLVVDCRPRDAYAASHVPGALAIPLRDAFPTWLGWLAPPEAPLLFVVGLAELAEVVEAALLVGLERFGGWLEDGMEAWTKEDLPVRSLPVIGPEDAVAWLDAGAVPVDVREPDEVELGTMAGAQAIPLGDLERDADRLPTGRPLLTYCAAGMRSVTGASILERLGRGPVLDLRGGYGAWQDAHRD